MKTTYPVNHHAIAKAAELLRAGRLVAIPTETVYGLGANASDPKAVRRVFDTKGRPKQHPVIVHVADTSPIDVALTGWVTDIPDSARTLAKSFWPGPLTMILRRGPKAHDGVTGGRDTVGVRVPGHPWALALVRAFGDGIAAPSANHFGHVSPTTAKHVRDEFGHHVDMILDGGPCTVGVESTIVDLSGSAPRLLRLGMITKHVLETALGMAVSYEVLAQPAHTSEAPGTLASHYAPAATMTILEKVQLITAVAEAQTTKCYPGILSFEPRPKGWPVERWIVTPEKPEKCARHLYASLRALDASSPDRILVESVPGHGLWSAIADRLQRAAAPR
ncbi:MAG: L-threonylcarbamoyladenylate synthase [Myxococcota bacterium]|nr:L-threonylcarbamoyladenylate synthase [Myxococcota bacterium]